MSVIIMDWRYQYICLNPSDNSREIYQIYYGPNRHHNVLRKYPSWSRIPTSPVCIQSVSASGSWVAITSWVCFLSFQYLARFFKQDSNENLHGTDPFCSRYPETQSSPGFPDLQILWSLDQKSTIINTPMGMGSVLPLEGSIILAFTCGITLPTVSTRCVRLSSVVVWKETGLQTKQLQEK